MGAVPVDFRSAPDFQVSQSIRVAAATYGDIISVDAKQKDLAKFGRRTATTQNVKQTVMDLQGTENHETFVTTNAIDSVASTSTSDVGKTINYEGHTIDGSGNLTFFADQVTLNGQNRVALPTPCARINRGKQAPSGSFASPATALAGVVSFYASNGGAVTLTTGTPSVASATKMIIRGDLGINQSQKAQTSISQFDYWLIDGIICTVGRAGGAGGAVDFDLEIRDVANGGVWLPIGSSITVLTGTTFRLDYYPHVTVPKNHDVRAVVVASTNNMNVGVRMRGHLAKIVG